MSGGGLCLKSTALSAELILGMAILVLNIKALYRMTKEVLNLTEGPRNIISGVFPALSVVREYDLHLFHSNLRLFSLVQS